MDHDRNGSRNGRLTRRGVLLSGAALASSRSLSAAAATANGEWDLETDVICVGSGAAACSSAIFAVDAGARVILVEKMPVLSGTTGKSGGVAWIPNNSALRKQGIADPKADCMRYMARYAYPQIFDPSSPTLGLSEGDFALLEAFYDNASVAVDRLEALGAVTFKQFRLFHLNQPAPDYADHLPENKVPTGRSMDPAAGSGRTSGGKSLAAQMAAWLRTRDVPILVDTAVQSVVMDGGRAIGVVARTPKGFSFRIKAQRGIVFGTGGFAHNQQLCFQHQPLLDGSCALPGATGDFVTIAGAIGAQMGDLGTGWRTQVLFEEAAQARAVGGGVNFVPGDSMVIVNKYGHRVVNEKRCYNDRTRAHFIFDPTRTEYSNQLLFMVVDARCLDLYGGSFPFPADMRESQFWIAGDNLPALASAIDKRLAGYVARTGGLRLDPTFASTLAQTIQRFNGFAESGTDADFGRGEHLYDREWNYLSSQIRAGSIRRTLAAMEQCIHLLRRAPTTLLFSRPVFWIPAEARASTPTGK